MNRENIILELMKASKIMEPQIVGNIAMIGLVDPTAPDESEVLSLTRAIMEKKIEIQETDEGYTRLAFSPQEPTLLRSSEGVIKGGKQDRIVKRSRVLTETRILDVYCIERGRWSRGKDWIPVNLPVPVRRAILEGRDQSTLWEMIHQYLREWGVRTRTQALGAIYDALGKRFEKFVANFEWWKDQVGMIVVINGVVSGLEYFGYKESFRIDGMALLRESYVPEALRGEKVPMLPGDVSKALTEFEDEVKTGKRRWEVVPYQDRIVYANVV